MKRFFQRLWHAGWHGSEWPGTYMGTPHCPQCLEWMKKRIKIRTEFVNPPIPDRSHDWSATRHDYEPGDYVGRGRTEADAVADLIEQEAV